jgi:hypothetical protein
VLDFRAHLPGRMAWIGQFNAQRHAKPMRIFERIAWPGASPTPS